MGDVEQIKGYVRVDKFRQLNPFEKVLLVHTLVEKGVLVGEAKRVVEMMELEDQSVKKDYQEFKHNFDTIINAKAEEN